MKSEEKEIKAKLLIIENQNIEFNNKIEEQNRGLKILLEKTRDYEKLVENELNKTKKLNDNIVQLKTDNEKYKSENLAYKAEIQHLENKKNELKKIKETKVLEINLLNKENIKLENKISNFENEIIELKTKQNILEDTNRKNEIEIERQKKLKWYQKLIGKR